VSLFPSFVQFSATKCRVELQHADPNGKFSSIEREEMYNITQVMCARTQQLEQEASAGSSRGGGAAGAGGHRGQQRGTHSRTGLGTAAAAASTSSSTGTACVAGSGAYGVRTVVESTIIESGGIGLDVQFVGGGIAGDENPDGTSGDNETATGMVLGNNSNKSKRNYKIWSATERYNLLVGISLFGVDIGKLREVLEHRTEQQVRLVFGFAVLGGSLFM
jgi:hypothetical protein